jgi:hypothetical protein
VIYHCADAPGLAFRAYLWHEEEQKKLSDLLSMFQNLFQSDEDEARAFVQGTLSIVTAGNTNWGERLSTVDLLIKVTCFVKNVNNIFNIKRSRSIQVSTSRSTVLSLPLQLVFLGYRLK